MLKPACSALFLVWSALFSMAADQPPAPAKPPAPPAAADAKPASPPAPAVKPLGGPLYELNGISFNAETRAIRLPGLINMTQGLLEYALVHEEGKAHESLLTTKVSPFDLNVVLLLLNYEASTTFFDLSDKIRGALLVPNPKTAPKAELAVTLEWKDPKGQIQTARLESLLLNAQPKTNLAPGPFIFTGSMVMDDGTFMAKESGSILALFADPASLINNPRAGNEMDDTWLPDTQKLPPQKTPVTVIISPHQK